MRQGKRIVQVCITPQPVPIALRLKGQKEKKKVWKCQDSFQETEGRGTGAGRSATLAGAGEQRPPCVFCSPTRRAVWRVLPRCHLRSLSVPGARGCGLLIGASTWTRFWKLSSALGTDGSLLLEGQRAP